MGVILRLHHERIDYSDPHIGRVPEGEHIHDLRCTCGLRLAVIAEHEPDPLAMLTPRQREVFLAYFALETREAAAEHLGITVPTMKAHLSAIYRRLGVQHQREAAWLVWGPGRRVPTVIVGPHHMVPL